MGEQYRVGVVCIRGIGPEKGGRSYNEDNFLVCDGQRGRFRATDGEVDLTVDPHGLLCVVADGMGGHDHGDVASGAAVQSFLRLYARGEPANPEAALAAFLRTAHERLRDHARDKGAANMGTTVTAAWFLRGEMAWVHVGDSRLYLLREERLSQISRDHTRGEFAERDGQPLPYAPGALTQNFIFGSRGLEDDDAIRVDEGRDTGTLSLQPGDRILLTSDGVHGFLDEDRIMAGLSSERATSAARWLVEEAMTCGSDDNVTAIVIFVDSGAEGTEAGWSGAV